MMGLSDAARRRGQAHGDIERWASIARLAEEAISPQKQACVSSGWSSRITRLASAPGIVDVSRGFDIDSVIAFSVAMGHLKPLVVSVAFLFPFALLCRPAGEGVYTKQQAARGQTLYAEECAKCHGANLSGGDDSPELAGADFMSRWKGKKVSALFTLINKTMPTDDPGHLSTRQSADLTAFILSSNSFPAGPDDLPNNVTALNDIAIEGQK